MVLSAPETIEIENLKHSHELQILDRKEEIAKSEHQRALERLEREYEVAKISFKSDPAMINVLNVIAHNIDDLRVSLNTNPVKGMRYP